MMNTNQSMRFQILRELRSLLADLGKDGGKISPSIYDTAQRLRFYPPPEGVEPALDWLLTQQEADGGWCDPAVPAARDASTLAAILALKQYRQDREAKAAIDAGLAFLRKQAAQWASIPLDGLPIAAEMVIPRLLEDAQAINLDISLEPYRRLICLRNQKLQHISTIPPQAGAAFTYSWEALNLPSNPIWLDSTGGVGHSPAATARWLQLAAGKPELNKYRICAEDFLLHAHRATDSEIPGVVPVVFPITGFELSYGLFSMLVSGMLTQAEFLEPVTHLAIQMQAAMADNHGYTFGESFAPDADSTAVAMAVLSALGYPVVMSHLTQFEKADGFATFHQELNASIISNAHALIALAIMNRCHPAAQSFLLDRQRVDGEWLPDKWHSSWLYSTLESAIALSMQGQADEISSVLGSLVTAQRRNGGWGTGFQSTLIETSYAVLALRILQNHTDFPHSAEDALDTGQYWLEDQIMRQDSLTVRRWLGKELYRPLRVDRMYELCTMLSIAQSSALMSEMVAMA